jgi:chorismate-pyruvate lyase
VYVVAARAFPPTADPVEKALCDLDGNGTVNINDVYLAAQNSNLVKAHSSCPSEG